MTKALSNQVRVKRLKWQIKDIIEIMLDNDGIRQHKQERAILARQAAIDYLNKKDTPPMTWNDIRKKFHFDYDKYNNQRRDVDEL